ncbi:general secretion pathway protein A [Geobacter sp. OR-1]|uniref:ExeA family protein n=1 Tax=Geobacter sp. OR-1 TaxID=1266765 RepID=UPI000542E7AA|nr:ExeA family protein [Geobacter sp. OR-1]GAM07992.1 general secretion pathway protein A [Geobacter sp. OR-1]
MYWEQLGFKEPPFALTPNPEFLFMSRHHQEAFAHLLFAIDTRAGFIELSGEVGTGKTTIIRTFLGQLSSETCRSAFIFNPTVSPLGLLQEINNEFGLPCIANDIHELHKSLNEFLLRENSAGHTVVLVIDEAQNLSTAVLEQVRLISNLETEQSKLIQIVLVGQTELQALLSRQELRQLNQRITVRYHLEPMAAEDVHSYIRHRIRVAAGGKEPVTFTAAAADKIGRFSGGLPRLVNAVCDRALLLAYTKERREVTHQMAATAIADLIRTENPRRRSFRYLSASALIAVVLIAGVALYWTQIPAPQPSSPVPAAKGAASEDSNGVRLLQVMLKAAGHFSGTPDGVFDNRTAEAVRRFQEAEGLKVDGKPGGKTLSRLYQRSGGKFAAGAESAAVPVPGGDRK